MNKIFNQTTQNSEFKSLDLSKIMVSHYNQEALDVIKNRTVTSTIVQWNRQIGTSIYPGDEAHALGRFLSKFKIKSYTDLQYSNYVREISQVKYYGTTCTRDNVADGALRLINFFNDLASKDLIRGVLTPLLSFELVGGKIVIVSYIAVDQPNEALVQSMYGSLQFQEGGIPAEFV